MLEATRNSQKSQAQEQHILVIDDHECGVFALDAATYSIGRDTSNAIVLNDESVSRRHALLLRMPIPGENRYRYRLIDGNSLGDPSTNGTIVNGTSSQSHELVKGDSIQFGKNSFCTYLIISGEESEMSNYLASAEFQSIKANLVDPKATIAADMSEEMDQLEPQQNVDIWLENPIEPEQEDATIIFSKNSAARKVAFTRAAPVSKPSFVQQHWLKIVLAAGISVMVMGVGFWHRNQTSEPAPVESNVTAPES
ncbi:MAG: FHA domain-containing protein [Thermosynechococcaceae cyanobacterium]